ncbi:uncharacterized protein LOC131215307 [Anopheles bellator]|uniref:uncharacterized protein LOC131215307 n=1 Tax=Anopheles bellator TaxID=139047 RepID=UPI0026494DD2|nr:uncharacterized protein LOC131215307 [Anopheles bellator]
MHTAASVVSGPSTGRHSKQTQAPTATGDAARPALPPNVNSRPHGTLTVRFGSFRESSGAGVRWNSAKVYVSVDLQLIWWGQQTPSSSSGGSGAGPLLHWEQGNARQNGASEVVYEVRTSPELFRRYLKSCEPIRVRLVSKRTRTVIGTAQVQIPGKITNFRDPGSVSPTTTTVAQACGEVHSVRGFCLGEVCLELSLQFDRKRSATSGAGPGKENGKMLLVEQKPASPALMPLAVEGKPAPLHESSQRTLPAAGVCAAKKRFHTLAPDARQKILDYLTGRPIDGDGSNSELSALSEICSVSPAESMLEALTRYDQAPEPRKQTYLRAVDCVRVLVENLKFTRAGQKEIQHRANQQHLAMFGGGFVVRMKLLPTAARLKFTSTAVSETEVVFDAKPQQTRFGLPESATGEGLQFDFAVHLNVGSFYKTRLFFLGSASVTLQEVIEGRFACHKRCPIRLASDDILLGTLTVRLELGSRGIHFGPELIDAVLIDGGNVTLESSEASSDGESVEPSVTPEPIPSVMHCQHKHHHCHGSEARCVDRFPCYVSKCKTAMTDPGDNQSSSGEKDTSSHNQPTRQDGEGSGASTNGGGGDQDEQNRNAPQKNDRQPEPPNAMEIDGSKPEVQQTKLLHGLLYLGQLKDRNQPVGEHFLALQPFWTDEPSTLTSELCQPEGNFDYLRTFPVMATASFLERVRNQHLAVELWQKAPGEGEKLVGVTRLPLHQFYIAFRDVQLSDHLAHARLPVISIDGWSGIGSPLASEPCGQLQAVLAIGTESQIEHFRLTRSLPMHTSGDVPRNRLPAIETPRINPRSDSKSIQTVSCGGGTKQPQSSEVANMLSAFIENLAQRLPISSERSTAPSFDNNLSSVEQRPVAGSPHSQANRPQLRKTADLLDNLQKALAQRPSAAALEGFGALGLGSAASLLGASTTPADQTPPAAGTDETRISAAGTGEPVAPQHPTPVVLMEASESEQPSAEKPAPQPIPAVSTEDSSTDGVEEESCKLIRLLIEIERAVNLPQLTISKKYAKRQHHKNRVPNVPEALVLEPSAYATFEGHHLRPGTANTVKSHEGIVYTTHVIERNCAPGWQKRFEVQLPSDLMTNDEKRFIVKVWRKAALSDAPKCRLLPAPMEDAVIGFCAIDLSLLLSGLSCILGWYNIMDFSGRCNGQIKIYIKPLENVQSFKVAEEQQNFRLPLLIDVDCGPTMGLDTSSNTSLSRALKRKFIELEEITERLKARLFDVTGDDGDDDGTDPDDQFERDLNTAASEDDDDAVDDDQDAWAGDEQLEDSSNRKRNSQYPNGAMTITTNTSSYSMCATDRSSLTGCSNRASRSRDESPPPRPSTSQLAELLQSHDIDTLINPALFKNFLLPSTSESTPVLDGGETGIDADMSDESSVGCAAGGDRVKQIATALQRTTISDTIRPGEAQSSTVMVPAEGDGNGGPCREAPEGEPMKDVNK